MAKIDDSVKKKFPELRFPGFTDDWELRKLGEVYNFQYGQFNNNPDNGGQYPIYGANGIIGGYDEHNSENAIVIGHMGAYAGHVLWAEGKHFVTYNGTMGIADKSILNSNFGYYLVVSVNVPKLTAGSGQPFVSYSDLNGIKILIPTIEEQQKIGSFFKQLDNTIALHQRKLDLLKEQKKGYLQKMFPKNGAKVPELRFAGFADDWEERKLGDTETHFTDGNYGESYPSAKDMSDKANGIPFLRGSDFSNGYLDSSNANYIKPEKHTELTSGHIKQDDIVLAVRGSLGTLGYATKENEGWNINSQLAILRTNKSEISGMFLIQYLLGSKGQKEIFSRNTGTALKQLPIKQLKDIPVPVPTLLEQQKIGNFFKELDSTIALHQRKLDLLKEQKKGFLQKMFV
ncbi:hypothetical protein AYR56_12465 (plasmid) [Loigolactobacillus backii]|uniref:Type I restriction modification DNA specificity domain-containing protein n=1 Tax=Loigolactobacillus backii TaxID=375175 RepID=A0A192H5K1_9LACO|nr:restriction endonuclease subunit S [Loigolactobacillus backii]ANK63645.1 hypothetical protein AYR53_12530 [Loigolactobacillus backii]ANK71011.1 hypothetical protein AYR56_12465 [Loigolactobacillus backii]